jgi:hypothetical protein
MYETRAMTYMPSAVEHRTIGIPPVGQPATVEVGSNMTAVTRFSETPALELPDGAFAQAPYDGTTMRVVVGPGRLTVTGSSDRGGRFYSAGSVSIQFIARNGTFFVDHLAPGGVLQEGGRHFVYWKWDDHQLYVRELNPATVVRTVTHVDGKTPPSLRRELVYGGVSQGTVNILYREFINDMARPAFSQDLRYDLNQGNLIGYQGARFEVLKADNTGITYRVLSHLDASK